VTLLAYHSTTSVETEIVFIRGTD